MQFKLPRYIRWNIENLAHKPRNEPQRMQSTFQGLVWILRQLCDEGPEQVLFPRQVLGPGGRGWGVCGGGALNFETLEMWIKQQLAHLPRRYLNSQIRNPKFSACVSDHNHHGRGRGVVISMLFLIVRTHEP